LATNTRIEIVLIHLELDIVKIESLGHGKTFKTLGRIKFED